ncbi:Leucine-rich repeat domain superfamily [Sesbania bispinosa]|nr:Leucine-rich repeat domain superfamily [Sesbania bispinosa]
MMPAGLGKLSSLQSLSSFYVVDADQNKKAGKLNELQNLNNLRGNLEINTLGLVSNVLQESKEVNLKEKKLLETLDLNWGCRNINNDSSQLLENLCPHQHLKRLNVWWYPGVSFCKWLSSIMELSYISLFGFDNCEYLPPLELLPNLKSLEIGMEEDCQSTSSLCGSISCLSQLIINKCPKLNCMPTFPDVEKLQLCESAVAKPLRETLDIASSSSTPLSILKSLKIEGKLLDIKDLPSQWVRSLTSLEYLEIGGVEKLEIWFLDLDCFPSLRKIMVYDCELQALPNVMCNSISLKHIKLMGCRKLASLPEGMPRLTNLAILEIWDCPLLFERCQRETGLLPPDPSPWWLREQFNSHSSQVGIWCSIELGGLSQVSDQAGRIE